MKRDDHFNRSSQVADHQGGAIETPTRKQRLERSIRPSSARFTSPPKMRDSFDARKSGMSTEEDHSKQPKSTKPPILDTNLQSSEERTEPLTRHSSNEKVTTPHVGEEIVFTSSASSGKDEFRQDSDNSGSTHRSRKKTDRNTKRDGAVKPAISEDDSTEIGFEVSVKNVDTDNETPLEYTSHAATDEGACQPENRGNERGESSSGRSSVVFNFSGISKTKSTELMVSDEPVLPTPTDSISSAALEALYQEIEQISSRFSQTCVQTPKAANRSSKIAKQQNDFHRHYFSAKTLTSVYSSGRELSFGMQGEIMKIIGTLNAQSTIEQKQVIAQDLYKMGIRVQIVEEPEAIGDVVKDTEKKGSISKGFIQSIETEHLSEPSPKSIGFEDSARPDDISLSSDDIDKRWEAYRAKYLDQRTPTSSEEVDHRWSRFRERALTSTLEQTGSGSLGLTSDIEDDLIRDCIETGLPSPRMIQKWDSKGVSSRLHREECSPDEKMSLQAPSAHKHSTHDREVIAQYGVSDDKSCNPFAADSFVKRGQPDDEFDQQPLMVKRLSTWEELPLSEGQSQSNIMEDTDPILSIGNRELSEDISSSTTSDYEKEGQCPSPGNEMKKNCPPEDDETISSELSDEGAVKHFKNLSLSGREQSHFETSQEKDATSQNIDIKQMSSSAPNFEQQDGQMANDFNEMCKNNLPKLKNDNPRDEKSCVSNCETKPGYQNHPIQFLQRVLSSAASSCSVTSKSSRQKKRIQQEANAQHTKKKLEIPKGTMMTDMEPSTCPRIEVTLLSEDRSTGGGDYSTEKNSTIMKSMDSTTQNMLDNENHSENDNSIEGSGIVGNNDTQKELLEKTAEDKSIIANETEHPQQMRDLLHDETDILEVSSSLTGGTRGTEGRGEKRSFAFDLKDDSPTCNSNLPIDLSVSCTKGKSFESKASYSSHGVPSWRLDPSDSLSDFTLQILVEGSEEVISYHLHRHMLAVGPRRSEFLTDVFRGENSCTYQLLLEMKVSSFMPCLLDYIYCPDYTIDVTTDNAMVLRQLAKILKVVPLVVKIAGFILEDLDSSTMSTYVAESSFFNDDQVTELIVQRCSQHVQTIGVKDPLWAVMEPDLFLRVISSPLIDRETLSPHLSILVKEFLTLHQYEIDLDLFTVITSEKVIPKVDREAALPLIELCDQYTSTRCENLQKRCAHTLACFWKTTGQEQRHRLFALLRNLPSSFTVDFLEIVETGRLSEPPLEREKDVLDNSEREILEGPSFSIGDLCHDLAGDDGYSVVETDELMLSWRLDPEASFSDWTVKVVDPNLEHVDTYHVHKQILSLGPYRSEFFAHVFLLEKRTKVQGVTTLQLDHEAAATFPLVLDFIYTPDHNVHVTHENAPVLRYLARVLGVSMLSKHVLDFICKDMSLLNVCSYLKGAYCFEDERILVIASKLCATQIQNIDMDSPLLENFKPAFFARVVASSDIQYSSKCHLTILITKYFSLHKLDEDILAELLKHVEAPRIDQLSALKLLKILSGFERSQEIEVFDQLQRRCANILTENWNDIRDNHRDEVFSIFPLLHPTLLTEIFDVIDHQYMVQHYESMSLQSRLVKRYRAQLAEANHLREQEVFSLQKELEQRTADMLNVQRSLEKKLGLVNDSLNRRTGRSTAAYGIQLPSSPMNFNRGRMETRIPRLKTKSPSTLAAERVKAAREAAKQELNSATPCCPYSPVIQGRDDVSEAGSADDSANGSRIDWQDESVESTPTRQVGESMVDEQFHKSSLGSGQQPKSMAHTFDPQSAGAAGSNKGEDAELSA
ncbi:BTB/POZ domain containing protein [Nitzschia inconspicua]|uniref:BTB/POZ domain containing protein n=1 Tax=Nitzschia inconspicua TaxID=303405 RepID=A0A9K3KRS0_9STRA|nr:BTB/POZ domain containing protein [Nitzschia inconspicua]